MTTTPFTMGYGTTQGRIQPTDGPPFDGLWVLQLGSDVPGVMVLVNDNDGIMVSQTASPLSNPSFEVAGASPGLAAGWSVSVTATAQAFLDLSGSYGNVTPVETFDLQSVDYTASTSTSAFTAPDHGLPAGLPVALPAPPGGFVVGQLYYLIAVTTDTFQLSASVGGSFVTVTGGTLSGHLTYDLVLQSALSVTRSVSYVTTVATSSFFAIGHGLQDGLGVTIPFDPPAGIMAGLTYFVVNATPDTFQLSAEVGGDPVTLTGSESSGTIATNGNASALEFNSTLGVLASAVEDFENGWGFDPSRPGSANILASQFQFFLSTTLAVTFTGTSQTLIEDFEAGWGDDAPTYLLNLTGSTSRVTFHEGVTVETFGDTFVASVVALTATFTCSLAPDNATPIAFRSPAPSGLTAGTTYYTGGATSGGTTFMVSTTPGGGALAIGADGSGFVFDIVGPRAMLPVSDVFLESIGVPGGTQTFESFEFTFGTFSFVADPSTSLFTVAANASGLPFVSAGGQEVQVAGPGLPTATPAIVENVTYWTRDVTITGNVVTFRLSTTNGGTAISVTSVAGSDATIFGDPSVYWNELAP